MLQFFHAILKIPCINYLSKFSFKKPIASKISSISGISPKTRSAKMAFDIGGVLGKYPNVFRPMVSALQKGGAEVFVLTDMTDIKVAQEVLQVV